jgi:hypothetical protein
MRRLHVSMLGLLLLLLAASAAAAPASASPNRAVHGFRVTAGVFSPNGDGSDDELVIRYHLPRDADLVQLRISELTAGPSQHVRLIQLGSAERGSHSWTWDGRDKHGEIADDGVYNLALSYAGASNTATDRVAVDTDFSPRLVVDTGAVLATGANPAIYPRSTAVRDAIDFFVHAEHRTRRVSLTIRNPRGRAVLRRVERDVETDEQGSLLDERWTARLGGRALPPGRYRAVVAGIDRAGNHGRDVQPIWVSKERLVWHEEVRTILPSDSVGGGACFFDGGSGCADADYYNPPCGTVTASQLFAGGLSYRSTACPEGGVGTDRASSTHWLPLPEAPRGVVSARVRFVGTPTHAGAGDVGTLSIAAIDYQQSSHTTSGTGGETADVEPRYGRGVPADTTGSGDAIPPGVLWGFSTKDGNAVDVEKFVVTARYLTVAD